MIPRIMTRGIFLKFAVIAIVVSISCFASFGIKDAQAGAAPESFTRLAEKSSPAVVNISTVQTMEEGDRGLHRFFGEPGRQGPHGGMSLEEFFERFFGQQDPRRFQRQSLGSGFILDEKGYIVTNNHVIENAEEIKVTLKDDQEYDAKLIGTDPGTDIALIKIDAEIDFPVLELGDSEKLEIGQWVLAIGNPFGLGHTVTAGIVSAKGRVIGAGPYDDFIQTDASINPGNSGGPLIDMEGKVVGINTAIVAGGDGIGFAIPVSMAKNIIEQLREYGEVTRGWIGVGIQELDSDLKEYYDVSEGVLVTQVFPDDPADTAGIEQGDIIVAVNGKKVASPRELSQTIAGVSPGKDVVLSIVRDDEKMEVTATVEKRKEDRLAQHPRKPEDEKPAVDELGLEVRDIDKDIAGRLNLPDTDGVIVTSVTPDTKGAEGGFAEGDIIREINRQPVQSKQDYEQIVSDAGEGDVLSFYVLSPAEGIKIIRIQM